MIARSLMRCSCIVTLLVINPAYSVDVNLCSMVAEGRAEVISFGARMANGTPITLNGIVTTPPGAGPFPVIVMLPGGHGLFTPYCYRAVVEPFVEWGFVTLIVASTTARDEDGNQISQYSFADQANHAHGAISAVEKLPQVDRTRIGMWGHSLGGLSVIDAVSSNGRAPNGRIRAAVAIAPLCPGKAYLPTIPLLVMIGDRDTEVSVDACKDFSLTLKDADGFEFFLIPDADHLYWAPGTPGYDEATAKLSHDRLKNFLAKHLQWAH